MIISHSYTIFSLKNAYWLWAWVGLWKSWFWQSLFNLKKTATEVRVNLRWGCRPCSFYHFNPNIVENWSFSCFFYFTGNTQAHRLSEFPSEEYCKGTCWCIRSSRSCYTGSYCHAVRSLHAVHTTCGILIKENLIEDWYSFGLWRN